MITKTEIVTEYLQSKMAEFEGKTVKEVANKVISDTGLNVSPELIRMIYNDLGGTFPAQRHESSFQCELYYDEINKTTSERTPKMAIIKGGMANVDRFLTNIQKKKNCSVLITSIVPC